MRLFKACIGFVAGIFAGIALTIGLPFVLFLACWEEDYWPGKIL